MPVVLAAREKDEVNLANIVIKKIQTGKLSELVDSSFGFESDQPASSSKVHPPQAAAHDSGELGI